MCARLERLEKVGEISEEDEQRLATEEEIRRLSETARLASAKQERTEAALAATKKEVSEWSYLFQQLNEDVRSQHAAVAQGLEGLDVQRQVKNVLSTMARNDDRALMVRLYL